MSVCLISRRVSSIRHPEQEVKFPGVIWIQSGQNIPATVTSINLCSIILILKPLVCPPLSHKYGIKGQTRNNASLLMTLRNTTGRKLVIPLKYPRNVKNTLMLAENRCYLVKFFLAEPLILSSEVFIVDSQMMLEVVPGIKENQKEGETEF